MKKAIVIAGSRGIGKGIADSLKSINLDVITTSKKDLDTSNIDSVDDFLKKNTSTDILVMNTGGPPPKKFEEITQEDCKKYHNQLFYSFFKILQNIHIKNGGYIFLISSYNIKEPSEKLLLSNSYRVAFTSVLKCLTPIKLNWIILGLIGLSNACHEWCIFSLRCFYICCHIFKNT